MILKWGIPISLARVAGVARLGEQTEIAQAQFPDQRSTGSVIDRASVPRRVCQR